VKPVDLIRWLVRLVAPPGGLVLDPFTGSGTTGIACVCEGLPFLGFELSPEYVELARRRIEAAAQLAPRPLGSSLPSAEQNDPRQGSLF
jgi:site-specific DNA-methyltransferase (adenine-specific)